MFFSAELLARLLSLWRKKEKKMNDSAKTNKPGKLGYAHYTGLVPKLKATMAGFQNSLPALKIYLC